MAGTRAVYPKAPASSAPAAKSTTKPPRKHCPTHEIGWYAWESGPGNALGNPPYPLCDKMDMTPDGRFVHLKPGWAEEVAVSSPYGIKNTLNYTAWHVRMT